MCNKRHEKQIIPVCLLCIFRGVDILPGLSCLDCGNEYGRQEKRNNVSSMTAVSAKKLLGRSLIKEPEDVVYAAHNGNWCWR
jgi:hypothetical protein